MKTARTRRSAPERKALWTVRGDGNEELSLALVLSGYGDAWVAAGLGRAIGAGHTLYALQPPPEARGMAAPELAALYARHLRTAQPAGRYCVCGYSAGAVLALEVAKALRADGAEVGFVAMLDPFFVNWSAYERTVYRWVMNARRFLERIVPVPVPLFGVLAAMDNDEGFKIHLGALTNHRIGRYAGKIICYRTRQAFGKPPLLMTQLRWFTRASVQIEIVPGNHHTFIRAPHVADLGRRLRETMERAGNVSAQ